MSRLLPLALFFAISTMTVAHAQSAPSFGSAIASDAGKLRKRRPGNVFNGMAATSFQNKLFSAFVDDPSSSVSPCPGELAVQGYASQVSGPISWGQTAPRNLPHPDGQPQMTSWNGKLYLAYAAQSSDQLTIASSTDGRTFTYTQAGIQVYPGAAIGTFNNKLYVAYQQHASTHYLGVASSSDGVNFANTTYPNFEIGHSPALVQFGAKLIIANFCQCDSHTLTLMFRLMARVLRNTRTPRKFLAIFRLHHLLSTTTCFYWPTSIMDRTIFTPPLHMTASTGRAA